MGKFTEILSDLWNPNPISFSFHFWPVEPFNPLFFQPMELGDFKLWEELK